MNLTPIVLSVPLGYLYLTDRESLNTAHFATMSALSSLCLWTRALDLMSFWQEVGYFRSMFGFIAIQILPFIALFLILITAFADAFYTISNSLVEDARLAGSTTPYSARFISEWYDSYMYSYFTGAGEFDTDNYEKLSGKKESLAWIVFAMATFVNFVIVLNLLIAVVNDMYTKANQEQMEHSYRAKAGVVRDV